ETETGIDDDALAGDAARLGRGDALGEKRADLRHDVAVARLALHRARLPPHVHKAHGSVRARHSLERAGSPQRVDVVDHRRAGADRGAHHLGLRGIDGNGYRTSAKSVEHRHQPRQFLLGRYAAGSGAARLRADIDKIRSLIRQPLRMRDRGPRLEERPPSENESGVTLTTPATSGRSSARRNLPQRRLRAVAAANMKKSPKRA